MAEAATSSPTPIRTIEWIGGVDGFVRLIDQTLLPTELVYRDCRTVEEIWEAIRVLRVRGAPAIGIAGAMGVVLGMQNEKRRTENEERRTKDSRQDDDRTGYLQRLKEVADY